MYIQALCMLFLAGIVIQAGISFGMNRWLNPVNSFVGVIMMGAAIYIVASRGGAALDVLFLIYGFTDGRNGITALDHALARLLIGFFNVWAFANLLFVVFPFWASIGGFGLVVTAVPPYFMTRHLARQPIDWSRWVWFPAVNMGLGTSVCIFYALKPVVMHWLNS